MGWVHVLCILVISCTVKEMTIWFLNIEVVFQTECIKKPCKVYPQRNIERSQRENMPVLYSCPPLEFTDALSDFLAFSFSFHQSA